MNWIQLEANICKNLIAYGHAIKSLFVTRGRSHIRFTIVIQFVGPGLTEFRIDRISDWPNGFWSTWTYLFKHTKCTPFVRPRRFGQSEIRSIRCLPSACLPSIPTILVRISMKSTVLCVTFVFEKHEYKQKEVGDGPLFKKTPWKVYNIGKMSSYFKPFLPTPLKFIRKCKFHELYLHFIIFSR